MKMILAADENWGIGRDNKLLTHIPEDLKYFKQKTLGKVVVMGRKTLESLPGQKPLSDRTNIVLTQNMGYQAECDICHSEQELFQKLKHYNDEDIFIVGGAKVYKDMLPLCDTFYVTKIFKTFEADSYFENLDNMDDMELVWESDIQEHKGLKYKFTEYRRK